MYSSGFGTRAASVSATPYMPIGEEGRGGEEPDDAGAGRVEVDAPGDRDRDQDGDLQAR